MVDLLLVLSIGLNIVTLILQFLKKNGLVDFSTNFNALEKSQERSERSIREEVSLVRQDAIAAGTTNREELSKNLTSLNNTILGYLGQVTDFQRNQLDNFAKQLVILTQSNGQELGKVRKELTDALNLFTVSQGKQMNDLTKSNEEKINAVRDTLEKNLRQLQEDNNKKLEEMRKIVDEKLHATLEQRLGESFKLVSDRLEMVHKGLGEMQILATGVGDLKNVLTNVKTRGIWGEIQLENILEQILTLDQFERNVATKKNSNDRVEFAIKLPAKDDAKGIVHLPIDSKFPIEDYLRLIEAQEHGNKGQAELSIKQLEARIKSEAKDIRDKYIDPPNTTDFGILFLPTESLYAEVLRLPGLIEIIQQQYKVTIAGPTTMGALLNSLQMGFRTLAIEKRSSEVWQVLGAIKTEFGKFGDLLDKTQKKLQEASNAIDKASSKSRNISKKLSRVQELPAEDSVQLLGNLESEEEED